jgi:GR25 family glycosyltransferase involved in LPS biosynthesis
MLVYIVSLPSTERASSVIERFNSLGYSFVLSPAIDCRKRELTDLSNTFGIEMFRARYNRMPLVGEIGCTLSHLLTIQNINNNLFDAGVIFEDDAIPLLSSTLFKEIYLDILRSSFDIVVLGYSKANDATEKYINIVNPFMSLYSSVSPYSIGVRHHHSTCGTVGYVVKNKAIDTISSITIPCHLADDWSYYSSLGLAVGYISPMLVREDVFGTASSIGHDTGFIVPRAHEFIVFNLLLKFRRKAIGLYRLLAMFLKYRFSIEYLFGR